MIRRVQAILLQKLLLVYFIGSCLFTKKGKIKEKFRLDNNLEVDKEYEDDDQDIEEEAS